MGLAKAKISPLKIASRSGFGNDSALIPGPTLSQAWASVYLAIMLFVYLDEFGHVGPFVHRQDPKYKDSPVFGMAGIILPEASIRPFSTRFFQLKQKTFSADIANSTHAAYKWEKKGSEIFRPKAIERYPDIRQTGFRMLNLVGSCGGKVFFCGREKIAGSTDVNPNGLYTTVFSHTIRALDDYAQSVGSNFAMVVDEHSARKELLECAAKTMFGHRPTKRLVSPPFEVESNLDQNIQAADWVSAIVGRMWAYRISPAQYLDHEKINTYFGDRIARLATHSRVDRRKEKQPMLVGLSAPDRPATLRFSVHDKP